MTRIRRKGTAMVHTPKGILVVSGRSRIYALPGGGANKEESRKKAAMRELGEETGLKTKATKYLFEYEGKKWYDHKGKGIRNHTKVFLIDVCGRARPRHEIKYIAFWKEGSSVRISKGTEMLIKKYLKFLEKGNFYLLNKSCFPFKNLYPSIIKNPIKANPTIMPHSLIPKKAKWKNLFNGE